ncbi:MAG TPA: succinate dehydrogenase, hydrophobic membrane anchor protein [Sphingomicrobium sp.]|jgi:succinate dehydrogenase / fumarate reductase membrane anchor subunit|nr:succinate dehydrogenase, hydrophobic membrane anchor protein [Sphingomicrobium sp.]
MSIGDSATEIGKVRGLGSARSGGVDWLAERVSSVALLLLGAWFVASLLFLPRLDQRTLAEWLRSAGGAVPMALFVVVGFWHAVDGLKQVVDDYVDTEVGRWFLNTVFLFLAVAGASLCLFALGRIAFGAAA